jgi:hypothetical protein
MSLTLRNLRVAQGSFFDGLCQITRLDSRPATLADVVEVLKAEGAVIPRLFVELEPYGDLRPATLPSLIEVLKEQGADVAKPFRTYGHDIGYADLTVVGGEGTYLVLKVDPGRLKGDQ